MFLCAPPLAAAAAGVTGVAAQWAAGVADMEQCGLAAAGSEAGETTLSSEPGGMTPSAAKLAGAARVGALPTGAAQLFRPEAVAAGSNRGLGVSCTVSGPLSRVPPLADAGGGVQLGDEAPLLLTVPADSATAEADALGRCGSAVSLGEADWALDGAKPSRCCSCCRAAIALWLSDSLRPSSAFCNSDCGQSSGAHARLSFSSRNKNQTNLFARHDMSPTDRFSTAD